MSARRKPRDGTPIRGRRNKAKLTSRAQSSSDEESVDAAMGKLDEAICVVACVRLTLDDAYGIARPINTASLADAQRALGTGSKLLRDAYNRLDSALVNKGDVS